MNVHPKNSEKKQHIVFDIKKGLRFSIKSMLTYPNHVGYGHLQNTMGNPAVDNNNNVNFC